MVLPLETMPDGGIKTGVNPSSLGWEQQEPVQKGGDIRLCPAVEWMCRSGEKQSPPVPVADSRIVVIGFFNLRNIKCHLVNLL